MPSLERRSDRSARGRRRRRSTDKGIEGNIYVLYRKLTEGLEQGIEILSMEVSFDDLINSLVDGSIEIFRAVPVAFKERVSAVDNEELQKGAKGYLFLSYGQGATVERKIERNGLVNFLDSNKKKLEGFLRENPIVQFFSIVTISEHVRWVPKESQTRQA